jgi:hypothetical protein
MKHLEPWITYSILACICFTICNSSISLITSREGPLCIFYFSSGYIIVGAVYFCQKWYRKSLNKPTVNKKPPPTFNLSTTLGFISYMLSLFLIQNTCMLTIYCAQQSDINVGVITTLWRLNVFMNSLADRLIFG